MTTNLIRAWVSQVGRWNFKPPERPTYFGPQPETTRPYGICVSAKTFTEGTAHGTFVIRPQTSSEEPCARLIVGYVALDASHYSIGIGGYGQKYTLARYDPPGTWTLLKSAGTARDLELGHQYCLTVRIQGSKISLYDDENLVFEHVLSAALSQGSRLGLLAWGDCQIEYSNLSVDFIAPADAEISAVLENFDSESAFKDWTKALIRRSSDPEGALTSARTLLESVCKVILERAGKPYSPTTDLPELYYAAAATLGIAPNQQTEETMRALLGSCQQVVNRLGEFRSKLGDAHGKGIQRPVVEPRYAALAVNVAGAVAQFLVETFVEREADKSKEEKPGGSS